ncbi:Glycosyltransferase, catalytic subunit of cellulose synthase and poly-beta-1,6-N-acetylglucosamine synthase [Paenimyroides aquimaris]|uniref:Glycosyltransferase, catalytic subunit of cellulose synthase and poly-beta-1,6-N-acetylglucosamine synthase n=1 Tax=Paenimyroides marinum TaxID=1159016 RepID=A0A1H6K606_9FLAO|nr:glycosyltransferase [Paenimyroides aquimaris]SEH70501.1 Glycosyltransferase, catalytic subunit of cellulose synthase and poly-beta-1,6-N-acetylglucosamine synthase [Paenimyroides aquimaris]
MALTLLYILAGLFIILLVYYLGIFAGSVFGKPHETNAKRIPVSVIVYAKNNCNELRNLLPVLLNQNYHQFELVLVNNASTDDTLQLIKEYALMYPNIRIVDVVNNETFWGNKKYAVTLGVKASKYEYIVCIDADKKIHSNNWLVQLTSYFTLNKTIILGSFFYTKKKGFFNKLFRFFHTMQQMQSLAWTKISKPYSSNLQQIAFKKEEFYKVNGFISHMQKPLFMNEYFINDASTSKNTTICEHNEAMIEVESLNRKDFKDFKKQQLQLLSNLKGAAAIKIKLFNLFQFLFFVAAIASFATIEYWYVTLAIVVLRYIISWIIFAKAAKKFQYKDLVFYFPLFDLFYIFMQIQLFLTNLFKKSKS